MAKLVLKNKNSSDKDEEAAKLEAEEAAKDEEGIKEVSKKLATLRATKYPLCDPTRGMFRIPAGGKGVPVGEISPWVQSQIDAKLIEEL